MAATIMLLSDWSADPQGPSTPLASAKIPDYQSVTDSDQTMSYGDGLQGCAAVWECHSDVQFFLGMLSPAKQRVAGTHRNTYLTTVEKLLCCCAICLEVKHACKGHSTAHSCC